ncbi:zinc transporter foi [Culicoides brevitarsis]|uniref:zinc transporter foi n=1 Tax=Culicoides brevitarsis TaxID=469753 RepID=UPI00307C05CB
MARHLVAVCVVCLLCTEHFPCKGHIEGNENLKENLIKYSKDSRMEYEEAHIGNVVNVDSERISEGRSNLHKNKIQRETVRLKRHTHHHHHEAKSDSREDNLSIASSSKKYLGKIFTRFGGNDDTMTLANFNELLTKLELKKLVTEPKDLKKGKIMDSETCLTSLDLVQRISGKSQNPDVHAEPIAESRIDHHHHDHEHDHEHETHHNEEHQHHANASDSKSIDIDFSTMWDMCPILMYHVISGDATERSGCITGSDLPLHDEITKFIATNHDADELQDKTAVWIYATVAILGVSLCGLLGVAVIPCMDKHIYHHALQFFVALAVGTLCGDALLHLMPHSMIGHPGGEAAHEYMTYKGLAAVGGIVFFYFVERALTIIASRWAKHQKKEKLPSRVRVIRDPEAIVDQPNSGPSDKQCKHKYSSYPYCYNEIAMETKDDHHEHPVCINNSAAAKHNQTTAIDGKLCPKHGDPHAADLEIHQNDSEQKLLDGNYTISDNYKNMCNSFARDPFDSIENTTVTSVENSSVEGGATEKTKVAAGKNVSLLPEENYTIILREHERKHHGHSHTHGHVHSPPDSLSAVAWMVIMGDGLHNFTDGMAIGAAFSNNIAGGFSTAIAVFCHELPHELGDFAVLLKAGMSAKQAVFYNILSSILSFFGMVVGIIVGDTPEASAWIFAVAAGMFLYIALVDMIPELTSSHTGDKEERCQLSELILQFLGMAMGFGIMLLISIYEHDLKDMFSSDDSHSHEHHQPQI